MMDYQALRNSLSDDAQQRAQEKAQHLKHRMSLHEIRHTFGISQRSLAEKLNTQQANISKIEHRQDLFVSTIMHYIEALGGKIEILAHFDDQTIPLKPFFEKSEAS